MRRVGSPAVRYGHLHQAWVPPPALSRQLEHLPLARLSPWFLDCTAGSPQETGNFKWNDSFWWGHYRRALQHSHNSPGTTIGISLFVFMFKMGLSCILTPWSRSGRAFPMLRVLPLTKYITTNDVLQLFDCLLLGLRAAALVISATWKSGGLRSCQVVANFKGLDVPSSLRFSANMWKLECIAGCCIKQLSVNIKGVLCCCCFFNKQVALL